MRTFVYVPACIFTYSHIVPLSVDGKEWVEERDSEKERVGEGGKWSVAIRIFFSF